MEILALLGFLLIIAVILKFLSGGR